MKPSAPILFALSLLVVSISRQASAETAPSFESIYSIVRSNLAGASDAQLNDAAVKGFLRELKGQASLAGAATDKGKKADPPPLAKTAVFDGTFAYLRVARVQGGLAAKLAAALEDLRSSNKLTGIVLDLRFAVGRDYTAAAKIASLFLTEDKTLFSLDKTPVQSSVNEEPVKLPLITLVNRKTTSAAEALAAVLRQERIGLVIGSPTAGEAFVFQEFPLEGGQKLRLATQRVKLANGEAIGTDGVRPDIAITVSVEEEQRWFNDPYYVPPRVGLAGANAGGTNTLASSTEAARRRINEAELVRQAREGNPDEDVPPSRAKEEPARPLVRDPALARALDLLKGLAIVRPARGQ